MPSPSRADRTTHLTVVRHDHAAAGEAIRNDLGLMLTDLETVDEFTVERVAMDLQVNGVAVSSAVVALRQAAEEASGPTGGERSTTTSAPPSPSSACAAPRRGPRRFSPTPTAISSVSKRSPESTTTR